MRTKTEIGTIHALTCPQVRLSGLGSACHCIAGRQNLARRKEGLQYTSHDSTRAMERRRRQMLAQAEKARDW